MPPATVDDDEAPRLFTRRLELIAATPELARAASVDASTLAAALQAEVPRGWPPAELAGEQAAFAQRLSAEPTLTGWLLWYVVQVSPATLVGSIGFSGRPDGDGAVEVGYSFVSSFQRRGYATEAIGALIDWAFAHPEVRRIRAHTHADNAASIRVLQKNGLRRRPDGAPPGHVQFELARPD
jgi:ribosomal-protein-alanine N-acetyltransferase